jgi:hypothetical protein
MLDSMRAWFHKPASNWLSFIGLELLGLMILFGIRGWPRILGLVLLAAAVVVQALERRRERQPGPRQPGAIG